MLVFTRVDLRRLYKFLKSVEQDGGMKVLTEALSTYLRSQGKVIGVVQVGVDTNEQTPVASTCSAPAKSEVNPVAFMQVTLHCGILDVLLFTFTGTS